MDTAEQRTDGVWELTSTDPPARPSTIYLDYTAPKPRFVGWSLVVVALSNIGLIGAAIGTGLAPIGLVACTILALLSWVLVAAEILSIRRHERDRDQS